MFYLNLNNNGEEDVNATACESQVSLNHPPTLTVRGEKLSGLQVPGGASVMARIKMCLLLHEKGLLPPWPLSGGKYI